MELEIFMIKLSWGFLLPSICGKELIRLTIAKIYGSLQFILI